jgi:hypothetical protein
MDFDEKELYKEKVIPYIDFERIPRKPGEKPPKQEHRHETVDFFHRLINLIF